MSPAGGADGRSGASRWQARRALEPLAKLECEPSGDRCGRPDPKDVNALALMDEADIEWLVVEVLVSDRCERRPVLTEAFEAIPASVELRTDHAASAHDPCAPTREPDVPGRREPLYRSLGAPYGVLEVVWNDARPTSPSEHVRGHEILPTDGHVAARWRPTVERNRRRLRVGLAAAGSGSSDSRRAAARRARCALDRGTPARVERCCRRALGAS